MWRDITTLGSAYDVEVDDGGSYRHRRHTFGSFKLHWTPGAPPQPLPPGQLTDAEVTEMVRATPTRLVHYLQCLDCAHEWKAPIITGRCPRCRSERTMCKTVAPCIEKRV